MLEVRHVRVVTVHPLGFSLEVITTANWTLEGEGGQVGWAYRDLITSAQISTTFTTAQQRRKEPFTLSFIILHQLDAVFETTAQRRLPDAANRTVRADKVHPSSITAAIDRAQDYSLDGNDPLTQNGTTASFTRPLNMDQNVARKTLQELIRREDLGNKSCVDCGNPNPQWASVSFAILFCLQCAGVHRGFGVHISFVRSVSMDTWQSDQVRRMQLGGNTPFKDFMRSYTPAEQGGYKDEFSPYERYHCWAATQYREKLDCIMAGKTWAPSSPRADGAASPARPSSAQGLRKSRASARSAPSGQSATSSRSPQTSPDLDQKAANEAYFASLGQTNAARPADLPPSQGGRYQGFGNTPSPPPPSQHPSFALTSAAAPSLADFQENPTAALSKGWSLFSAAVAGASRVVNENVIQPGMERVMDPNLHASVRGYASEAQRRAQVAGQSANGWTKSQLGVDVADHVERITGIVKERVGPGPHASGYGSLAAHNEGETSALYHDDTDDFFHEYSHSSSQQTPTQHTVQASSAPTTKVDDWDDWKDF